MTTLLTLFKTQVPAEWLDYNDHMTEGYYAVAFGQATDALLFHIGLEAYKAKTNCTFYTAQSMIHFRRELKLGDKIHFLTQIVGADRKRLHLYHEMYHTEADYLAATVETMLLHYDQNIGQVVPMPDEIYDPIDVIAIEHVGLPIPELVGNNVRQVKK